MGSRMAFVAHYLGRRLAWVYEIVELSLSAPRDANCRRAVRRGANVHLGGGARGTTQMMLRNRGAPTGFSRLVAPFPAGAIRRANRQDLIIFGARCRSRAPPDDYIVLTFQVEEPCDISV